MPAADFTEIDRFFMHHCVELSRTAKALGEFPFVSIICREGSILASAVNEAGRTRDLTRHAEMLAISRALAALRKRRLKDCDIYSNIEPCPMCAFAIRESGIRRVVYGLKSPLMGGLNKWNILGDAELSRAMPGYFRRAPMVVGGVLARQVEEVWQKDLPLVWPMMKRRGCFVCETSEDEGDRAQKIPAGIGEDIWQKLRRWNVWRRGEKPA